MLPEYSAAEVQKALAILQCPATRNSMAANAKRFGQSFMNWEKGEEVLYREYSGMLPGALQSPSRLKDLQLMQAGGGAK